MKPLRPNPTPEAYKKGTVMERDLYGSLASAQHSGRIAAFGAADAWIIFGGEFALIEWKAQERFEAGWCGGVRVTFDGHGLERTQAERYMRIYDTFGIKTLLYIKEESGVVFKQWIHILEQAGYFDTPGTIKKVRRIYPLSAFA